MDLTNLGPAAEADDEIALSTRRGRWIVVAVALGSGVAFLDGSVVTVALPAIRSDLGGGFAVQQWVLDGYLLSLSALLLPGGALGDRLGRRRVFIVGLVMFTAASAGCGLAESFATLITARVVQGIGAALLIPGSLALIDASIRPEDRGRAVGQWAGLSGVASALGPFVGGWLADSASWRWIFWLNVPLAAAAVVSTVVFVPESRARGMAGRLDVAGTLAGALGLSGVTIGLIRIPANGWSVFDIVAVVAGVGGLVAFPLIERVASAPLIPLGLFRSAQFTGANLVTLLLYGALGGVFFLLPLQLEQSVGYSASRAGLAVLPFTALILLLSGPVGALAQRVGARPAMTVGPIVAGVGIALLVRAVPGATYPAGVFAGISVFGLGMAITIAPLTSTLLGSVSDDHVGAASGTNNAVSRIAGLVAVAVLPTIAGIDTARGGPLGGGFRTAMLVCSALCFVAGPISYVTIKHVVRVRSHALPALNQACVAPTSRLEPAPTN